MKNSNLTKELYEFVAQNDQLEVLEAKLKEFNPLNVLKIEENEIRHSNVLAWLLNPNENHGLGDKVLKKLLIELVARNINFEMPISIIQIQTMNFYDVQVKREHNNIDILVISKSNQLILLIENKIYAQFNEEQINAYLTHVKSEFLGYRVVPIALTLKNFDLLESDVQSYATLSHEIIFSNLRLIIDLYKESLNFKVIDFINFYLKILGAITMQNNNELVKLCKSIYRQHRDAIDAINKYGIESSLDTVFDEFKKQNPLEETLRNNRSFWFVPAVFKNKLPKLCKGWESEYPFSYRFRFSTKEDWLGIILEVGPIKDPQQRLNFMKILEVNSFKFSAAALELGKSKYTRFFTKYINFDEWDNEEKTLEQLNSLYLKDAKDATSRLEKVIGNFKW